MIVSCAVLSRVGHAATALLTTGLLGCAGAAVRSVDVTTPTSNGPAQPAQASSTLNAALVAQPERATAPTPPGGPQRGQPHPGEWHAKVALPQLAHYAANSAGPPTFPIFDFFGDVYGSIATASAPSTPELVGQTSAIGPSDLPPWPEKVLRLFNSDGSACTANVEGLARVVMTEAIEASAIAEWDKQGLSEEARASEVFLFGAVNAIQLTPSSECHGKPLLVQSLSEPVPHLLESVSEPSLEGRAIEFARTLPQFVELTDLYWSDVLSADRGPDESEPPATWQAQGDISAQVFARAHRPRFVRVSVDSGYVCSRWHAWRAALLEVTPTTNSGFRVVEGTVGDAMRRDEFVHFLAELDDAGTLLTRLGGDDQFSLYDDRWPGSRNWSVTQRWECPC